MPKNYLTPLLVLLIMLLGPWKVFSQGVKNKETKISPLSTVTAAFVAPDTVCVNSPVNITNISSGASSYFWNFCVSSLNTIPTGDNLGNINGMFSLPVFSDFVIDNGNYYLFVVNNYPGGLVRLDFGASMLNSPTAVSLGNFGGNLSNNAEGIQLVNVNGNWLAIIVGGFPGGGVPSQILKLDFGTNISNPNPIPTNWGNLGNMNYPIDLHIFQENNNWFGFTLNSENQTLTRFDFGADFSTPPLATNLGNIGNFSGPTGIFAINDNGFWRVFITNSVYGTKFTRLDFGSSLLNNPQVVDLGNIDGLFIRPRDIILMKLCDETVGFVVDSTGIEKLTFKDGLGQPPQAEMIGNIGGLDFPHSISKIFRDGADLFCFITNAMNNTVTRIRFSGCDGVSIPNSTLFSPPTISYSKPGTYNINLLIDDGLPTQTSFCKTITVVGNSSIKLGNDTTLCENANLTLSPVYENVTNVVWSTGETSSAITINSPGKYWVTSNDGFSCGAFDTISITGVPIPLFSLGKDTLLCENGSIFLQSPINADSYSWSTGETTSGIAVSSSGNYSLAVTKSGCSFTDTISVVKDPLGYVNLGKDTSLCGVPSIQLTYAAKADDIVIWSTGEISPAISVANSGQYWVEVHNSSGCGGSDSINVRLGKIPVFSLGTDTSKCLANTIRIVSPVVAEEYKWSTGNTSNFIDVGSRGSYSLEVTKDGCRFKDTINVLEIPVPDFSLGNDTLICKGSPVLFDLNGIGDRLLWEDGSTDPVRSIDEPGTYSVSVDFSGCSVSDEINIIDRGLPVINIGPDTALCSGQPFMVVPTVINGSFFRWENGSQTAVRTVAEPGIYIGAAENGCGFSYDTLLVKSGGVLTGNFNMANAFSPNGDGRNDCFGVSKLLLKNLDEFSIYNRFGQKIFAGKKISDCWDGKFNGKLEPEGAYVYIIRANTYCGYIFRKGIVLLQR